MRIVLSVPLAVAGGCQWPIDQRMFGRKNWSLVTHNSKLVIKFSYYGYELRVTSSRNSGAKQRALK